MVIKYKYNVRRIGFNNSVSKFVCDSNFVNFVNIFSRNCNSKLTAGLLIPISIYATGANVTLRIRSPKMT